MSISTHNESIHQNNQSLTKSQNSDIKIIPLKNYKNTLIHHSDRGSQYVSDYYTNLLEDYGIRISMCIDVLENAHYCNHPRLHRVSS